MTKDNKTAELSYPCEWNYKVIGTNEERLLTAIKSIFNEIPYVATTSRSSSAGKYTSLNVATVVMSEEERTSLFARLGKHAAIKMVL